MVNAKAKSMQYINGNGYLSDAFRNKKGDKTFFISNNHFLFYIVS